MRSPADRWRPRRAGIINLYEYSNQVFEFAGGRLLLRGHNTSGKTKALEVLLPFCLDGDVRPTKLDPFASGSKDMKWNLVGCADVEQRVGYVWIEFERLDESGSAQRVTAGVGLRAHKALPTVTRWYFVARGRTVGADLALLRGREPIGKADLAATLGDDGEVLDSQRDYRSRLNDLLFGFGGAEQYQTMLRLMLDLRRPHLSKTLNPDGVASQLAAGLPQVDEALMRRLAGGLEQLETLERGLARLRDVHERVRRFHQRTYAAYARATVRERAELLRQTQSTVDGATEELRAARAALQAERERAEAATTERDATEAETAQLSAEERALIGSAAWSSVAEVEALRGQANAQRNAARTAHDHAESVASDASGLAAEAIAAEAAAAAGADQADRDVSDALAVAERAGLAHRANVLTMQLRTAAIQPETWRTLVGDLAADWRDVLHRHRELLVRARSAGAAAEQARAFERSASARVEEMDARRHTCEEHVDAARDALGAELHNWRASLVELRVDDETIAAALELAERGQMLATALAPAADAARAALADERATREAARRDDARARDVAEADVDALVAARDDGPPAPAWARASRSGRAGAPLWRLIDFARDVSEPERAALEGALEAMGLLDAWVTPTGRVEQPEIADVLLIDDGASAGATLADVLVATPDRPVPEAVVTTVLERVGLGERRSGPWVDRDGRFVLGPLAGRGAKPEAEHIGAAAREARRARRIAALRARIVELEEQIAEHDAVLVDSGRRRDALATELRALPSVDRLASASAALRTAAALESEAGRRHEQALAAAREAADTAIAADAARREHAVDHGLAPHLDEGRLGRSPPGMRRAAQGRDHRRTQLGDWRTRTRSRGRHRRTRGRRSAYGGGTGSGCRRRAR